MIPLGASLERANGFSARSKSPSTLRAYRACWIHFQNWCVARGLISLPADPQTISLFIADCATKYRPASISLRMAAISFSHRGANYESPTLMHNKPVRDTWDGIKRSLGMSQKQKRPLMTEDLRSIMAALPDSLRGLRDAALLLVGFASACRRSELAALTMDDLQECEEGLKLNIRSSQTDQEGKGQTIGVPYGSDPATCPVRAMRRWLAAAGITEGFAFRGVLKGGRVQPGRMAGDSIALATQRACKLIGLAPLYYGASSLRSGFATQAARSGCSEGSIRKQTRHKRCDGVARLVRDPDVFQGNASTRLGL